MNIFISKCQTCTISRSNVANDSGDLAVDGMFGTSQKSLGISFMHDSSCSSSASAAEYAWGETSRSSSATCLVM